MANGDNVQRTPPESDLDQLTDRYYDAWRRPDDKPTPAELAKRKFGSIDSDIELPKDTSKPFTLPPTLGAAPKPLVSPRPLAPAPKPLVKPRALAGGRR